VPDTQSAPKSGAKYWKQIVLNLRKCRIGVVGLGYVGLPLAVEFGKHFETTGFDVKPARIAELKAGRDSTLEVTRQELKSATHLSFTTNLADLKRCRVFIVTVPTPIDGYKRPDLTPLERASESVGKVMKKGDVVVYESTVYPGCTEEICVPILERESGLTFNRDFFAGYSPERINPDVRHAIGRDQCGQSFGHIRLPSFDQEPSRRHAHPTVRMFQGFG